MTKTSIRIILALAIGIFIMSACRRNNVTPLPTGPNDSTLIDTRVAIDSAARRDSMLVARISHIGGLRVWYHLGSWSDPIGHGSFNSIDTFAIFVAGDTVINVLNELLPYSRERSTDSTISFEGIRQSGMTTYFFGTTYYFEKDSITHCESSYIGLGGQSQDTYHTL
ncbi:MAG: hypothetical protein JSS82_12860 [Bacteroidetes bacterium]|nr:hypothetical protein [Bacteroidota bacterium]